MQHNGVITLSLKKNWTTPSISRWKLNDSVCRRWSHSYSVDVIPFAIQIVQLLSMNFEFSLQWRKLLQLNQFVTHEIVGLMQIIWIEWKWKCGSIESIRKMGLRVIVWMCDLRLNFHLLVLFTDSIVTVTFNARVPIMQNKTFNEPFCVHLLPF